jgi:eukaryotic-like serine/threonine-protein kinase
MDLPVRIGRYDVERLLGQGGMGRVLLARDTVLGREVALKVLRDDLGLTPELKEQLVERMRQEARAAATLSHPAMVTLHDMGQDEHVGLYLVFERIVGPTLRERLEASGPLPPAEVARLARALGSALSHAHAAGVVHRDVKPENVMLSPSGPKLADFGIARLPDSTLTRATTVLGTPAYSAPEALAAGTYSAASDQFSLAAMLYEALTGKRAFPGEDVLAVATRVATGKQPAATAMRPALAIFPHVDVILDRALAKEARNRFASCEAFGGALAAELEGGALLETPLPRTSIATRATRRWQNRAMLAALLLIGALVMLGRMRQADEAGVSLRSVASAFAATAVLARGVPAPAPSSATTIRHPHAALSAASAPSPATTPSGSSSAALDSAPPDAGRQPASVDVRAGDAAVAPVAADAAER